MIGTTLVQTAKTYIGAYLSNGAVYTMRLNGTNEPFIVAAGADNGDWFGDCVGLDSVSVGCWKNITEEYFYNGLLAELLVCDGVTLTADQIAAIELYLNKRYGAY